jgi:magnesium-transporting ATPase (P-type)
LNLGDVTFPQIIIRGVYIGGCDDLQTCISTGLFSSLLSKEHLISSPVSRISWEPSLLKRSATPDLLQVPTTLYTKSKWYSKFYLFNWHMYSNLVRYISMVHAIMFLILLVLYKPMKANNNSAQILGNLIFNILIFDLIILVCLGPSPFSISGFLGTYFGWKYKGNVTSSIPYKVVFGAYLLYMFPLLFGDNSIHSSSALAIYIGSFINSSILVVFRF